MWTQISQHISETTGKPFTVERQKSVSGGCINQGYCLIGSDIKYFVKINHASKVEMFAAEALGLKEMAQTQTIRVPKPICWGMTERSSYIVLEWLEFGSSHNSAWEEMGIKLAKMHNYQGENKFGWSENNTIGSTPQVNNWTDTWSDFFANHRIGFQLKLANRKGGNFGNYNQIVDKVRQILASIEPKPSLVHGDLWSGNVAVTDAGEPVILDPATYYGDREVDLAMTELFGGFPAAFYRGYNEVFPLDKGYKKRKTLYNLYHILNHFNLFGGGYGSQANFMIQEVLKN
ncbi:MULTISPECIES: fructosamine kinase family protein [Crocosphaera]|uniref:Fructosamine kinase family protein, At3g61080 homolog n=3 Tax=Crocosphaera watsonii TaxID=263511 RepID=T2JNA6_CROWT|nr:MULTISPECIES: fructosamine kinase family protein [Crocosphaera]EHJ12012.1 Fructosamine kinase family protein [Crocosphaera watsonii WH 0003]MCH2244837.1 fructosamine kinase family protein [Crocosphaera sp.]CCQ56243.1 Fructosamine kinase family protein, At3g61080 homolog [Crocosphaera watsonii WH 0005]CCQ66519.1 Fructosamine kinase family protein, At3g61080 homolog [Crocosphaera watsonii WH 0402]